MLVGSIDVDCLFLEHFWVDDIEETVEHALAGHGRCQGRHARCAIPSRLQQRAGHHADRLVVLACAWLGQPDLGALLRMTSRRS
jgi:hypothetical protein